MVEIFPSIDWKPGQPASSDVLWRYIDFTQFISILENGTLWFPRANGFFDSYEGALPESHLENIANKLPSHIENPESKVSVYYNALKNSTYISCWHERRTETASMWQVYQNKGKEVAIKTTKSDFEKALIDDETIVSGRVKYINYNNPDEFVASRISPFFYKRESFRHEEEFRAVISQFEAPEGTAIDEEFVERVADRSVSGIAVDVDVDQLVDEVRVSPVAGGWVKTLVKKVINTYDMDDVEVLESDLEDEPYEKYDS